MKIGIVYAGLVGQSVLDSLVYRLQMLRVFKIGINKDLAYTVRKKMRKNKTVA